ncbi:hypothetical protein Vretimale_20002 [Volvox reticuliferus]|uniref:Uncharacterized protein n=1 Tax=Volvox reticuliferus TaxID=1737510 RepID=A0A8J4GXP6_9CHLO|nr:hypothetical protein Vretimale_20002 [Volvox reticuliferus]
MSLLWQNEAFLHDYLIICAYLSLHADAVEIYPAGSSPYGTSNIGPGKLFTDTQAKWIWCNSAGGVSASIAIAATFTTTFLNTVAGAEALLNIIVDDIAEIYLNGVYITKVQWGWNNAEDYTNRPVRLTLATGTNTLSIRVQILGLLQQRY